MQNFTVLVSGGASGLGKNTVRYMINRGAKVALIDLPNSNGAFFAKSCGDNCLFIPADVSDDESVKNVMAVIRKKYGQLNAAVCCAGIAQNFKMFSFKKEDNKNRKTFLADFCKVVKVNVFGVLSIITHAADLMAENEVSKSGYRGVLVNTSSISAYQSQFGQTFDATSAGALNALTSALAQDYRERGIRFVSIATGLLRTPLTTWNVTETNLGFYEGNILSPSRLGMPEEFAALTHHIILNEAINGEVIRLDGGLRMPP